MDKPKGKPKRGRPPVEVPKAISLAARGTPAHYRALRKLTATTRHSMSVQILIAIEEMLAKHNLWPPESGK